MSWARELGLFKNHILELEHICVPKLIIALFNLIPVKQGQLLASWPWSVPPSDHFNIVLLIEHKLIRQL